MRRFIEVVVDTNASITLRYRSPALLLLGEGALVVAKGDLDLGLERKEISSVTPTSIWWGTLVNELNYQSH